MFQKDTLRHLESVSEVQANKNSLELTVWKPESPVWKEYARYRNCTFSGAELRQVSVRGQGSSCPEHRSKVGSA